MGRVIVLTQLQLSPIYLDKVLLFVVVKAKMKMETQLKVWT